MLMKYFGSKANHFSIHKRALALTALLLAPILLAGCSSSEPSASAGAEPPTSGSAGIPHQKFADAVHAVMMADRTVYATHVVTRLKKEKSPTTPSEYWQDEENKLPLPAQMFRMGAELVQENPNAGFSYALKSKWPLNEQNKAQSPVEIEGLDFVAENKGQPFYGEEEIGGVNYFTAVYGDAAVAEACWTCHNEHSNREPDYPEFEKGDVMGGVVVRVPMN